MGKHIWILLGMVGFVLFSGCRDTVRRELSEPRMAEAVVDDVAYKPSSADSKVEVSVIDIGNYAGIGVSGNLGVKIADNLVVTNDYQPESVLVVFAWKHGRMETDRKDIYERFKDHKGEKVDLTYTVIYRSYYGKDENDDRVLNAKVVDGYVFVDATLKENEE